jgi:hypothetical protein
VYRNLNADLIVQTCRANNERITERFPGSGLSKVSAELLTISEQAAGLSAWLARPHIPLRTLAGLGILSVFVIVAGIAMNVKLQFTITSVAEFFQGSEAAISEIVFIGVAVFVFISLETRLKRRRALEAIHELRAIAHIIHMHQLTKDPERISTGPVPDTTFAKRPQNPAELMRYLDYCSDLLALISKIAALYVQGFQDPVLLDAVDDVEDLTSGLSRKIWQKIIILDNLTRSLPKEATLADPDTPEPDV